VAGTFKPAAKLTATIVAMSSLVPKDMVPPNAGTRLIPAG
jgi:hypothetical protein